jgi:SEC-C motif domain protein
MSRRTSPHVSRRSAGTRTSAAGISAGSPCPCGLSTPYGECCGRFHDGQRAAATAEQLMRSRYSAYAAGDRAYVMRTWHPSTRPTRLDLDGGPRWVRLEVVAVSDGTAFHTEGTVAFRAYYRERGAEHVLAEHSRFVRHEAAWVYVEALPGQQAQAQPSPVGPPGV